MALTAVELELYNIGRDALPPWYAPPESINEQLGARARIHGASAELDKYWLEQQAFILTAEDAWESATPPFGTTPDWLGQHAIDRGTSRQDGEDDVALRQRLRSVEESLHPEVLRQSAQNVLIAAGIPGTVALLEMPKDEAYMVVNQPRSGVGGFFGDVGGGNFGFNPAPGDFFYENPPFQPAGRLPAITYRLVISGAASAANNGTFTVLGIDGDAAFFANAGVGGVDATVNWRIDRYWHDGAFMTAGAGRDDAYLDRGYRLGGLLPAVILILPFDTPESVRLSVLEMLRAKKAAGVGAIVERRAVP